MLNWIVAALLRGRARRGSVPTSAPGPPVVRQPVPPTAVQNRTVWEGHRWAFAVPGIGTARIGPARTKSEARALLKKLLGLPLPPGTRGAIEVPSCTEQTSAVSAA